MKKEEGQTYTAVVFRQEKKFILSKRAIFKKKVLQLNGWEKRE